MVERTLEDVMTDFFNIDQSYKEPMDDVYSYIEKINVIGKTACDIIDTWEMNQSIPTLVHDMNELVKDIRTTSPNMAITRGAKYNNVSTWQDCWALICSRVSRLNDLANDSETNKKDYTEKIKLYWPIEPFDLEIKEMQNEIRTVVLFLGLDYLYRFNSSEKEKDTRYTSKYVKAILDAYPKEISTCEEAEALQSLLKQFSDSKALSSLDIKKSTTASHEAEAEIKQYGFSETILDIEKKQVAKDVYERTRIHKRISDTDSFEENSHISNRYTRITEPTAHEFEQAVKNEYLFFSEIIGYVKKTFSHSDLNGVQKIQIKSSLKTVALLLLDLDASLPLGSYIKKNEGSSFDRTGASWTFERLSEIFSKVQLYSNFPLVSINQLLHTKTDKKATTILPPLSKKKENLLIQILHDWACEDLLHLERLDLALSSTLEAMKKINTENQDEIEKREIQLCILYANLVQFPVKPTKRVLGYFETIADQLAKGEAPSEDALERIFWLKNVLYNSLISSCVYYLFTSPNGHMKTLEEIKSIVYDIASEVSITQIKKYNFKLFGTDSVYTEPGKLKQRNTNEKQRNRKTQGDAKSHFEKITPDYTKESMSKLFRYLTSQFLFQTFSDMSVFRNQLPKMRSSAKTNESIYPSGTPTYDEYINGLCIDAYIVKHYADEFKTISSDPQRFKDLLFHQD